MNKTIQTQAINLERLMETFKISNSVGQVRETGVQRLALSKEDKIMRDIFVNWLREENLDVRVDDFGNIYGRRDGLRNDLAPVMTGSHLDTQLYGGRYDGILGVLSALELIRVLNENNIQTLRPIEIVVFSNEEGVRFNPPTLGSGGITNVIPKKVAYESIDENGCRYKDELRKIGYLGLEKHRPKEVHRYVELHIEQDPILDEQNIDIGVVEGDKGIEWLEVTVKGSTGHSSSTPMNKRKDALFTAAEIIVKLQEMIEGFSEEGTVTIGQLHVEPGTILAIPSEVTFTINICHEDEGERDKLIETIQEIATTLAEKDGLGAEIKSVMDPEYTSSVQFSDEVKREIESVTEDLGYSMLNMISSGGHDANNMLKIAPTGIIFIPCKDGISHSVEEYAEEEHIEKGANVLLNTVIRLAQQS